MVRHIEKASKYRQKITMSKVYIIRKYIVAEDIHDAMKQEPSTPIHECFLEEESVKDLTFRLNRKTHEGDDPVGFVGDKFNTPCYQGGIKHKTCGPLGSDCCWCKKHDCPIGKEAKKK